MLRTVFRLPYAPGGHGERRPTSTGLTRSPTAPMEGSAAYRPYSHPAARFPSAASEKRAIDAEMMSDARSASLRSAITPEEWRARAEASWRAQAGASGTARTVKREERLMLEAQELSAQAEEWRLRAEEAWERHLIERDDSILDEMKDAQRRAKKAEAKLMDKLALLAVTEEEVNEARVAASQVERDPSPSQQPQDRAPSPQPQTHQLPTAPSPQPPRQLPRVPSPQPRQLPRTPSPPHQAGSSTQPYLQPASSHAHASSSSQPQLHTSAAQQHAAAQIQPWLATQSSSRPSSADREREKTRQAPGLATEADRGRVLRAEDERREQALEELARRRVAQELVAQQRRSAELRKGARATYHKGWDTIHHDLATSFLGSANTTQPFSVESFPWPLYGPTPRDAREITKERVREFVYDGVGGFAASTEAHATAPVRRSNEAHGGGTTQDAPGSVSSHKPAPPAPVAPNAYHMFPQPGPSQHQHSNSDPYQQEASSGGPTGAFQNTFNAGFAATRPTGSFAGIGAGSGNYAGVGSGASMSLALTSSPGAARLDDNGYDGTGTIILGAAPGSANYTASPATVPPPLPPKDTDDRAQQQQPFDPAVLPRPDMSKLSRSREDVAARRAAAKSALKTWTGASDGKNGDKFAARLMRLVEPGSRDVVLEGHATVVRILLSELVVLD